jgi:stress-induced-phosphoprotein 1
MSTAEDLKLQGNEAFTKKDFDAAISLYSQAIALDTENHVLYSNRRYGCSGSSC